MQKSTPIFWVLALLIAGTALAVGQAGSTKKQVPTKSPAATASSSPQASASPQVPAANSPLKTEKDKVSYAIGMNIGENFKRQGIEIDDAMFLQGLKDVAAGGKTLLTDEEARTVLTQYQGELRARMEQKQKEAAETNKKEGAAFLDANKAKPGVVTLPSGLQYKILKEGTGPKPTATDTVVCNYRGTLIDGKEFDSSYKRGQPATFPVSGVIKGWTEALQLMPVGSKWELFIPSDLAYAERGAGGGEIGPNSTLIFEVELLSIQGKPEDKKPAAPSPKPGDKKPETK